MNGYDGKVVIKTALDTKSFDAQIKKVEDELDTLEQEYEILQKSEPVNSELLLEYASDIEKTKNKLVDLYSKQDKLIKKQAELTQQQIPEDFLPDANILGKTEEVQSLISKLQMLKNAYGELDKTTIKSDDDAEKMANIREEINKTIKALEKLTGKKWRIEGFEENEDRARRMNEETDKGAKEGAKALKKFGLALFRIGSIYGIVSKASSAYLSQDTELAQKLQNVWVGLGSFLEPLLNTLSNALLKGLGYLNVFVKALTGVDYIARANAKALNKQTEAQKKLNKATQDYDFDVIRKQQDLTSSKSAESDFSGIEIPELDDKIVRKLQDLAKWLKENEELVKAVGIALGVTFGAVAIAKLLKNIGLLVGSEGAGTGLAGLGGLLKFLGTIGVISISVALLYTALTGRDLIEDFKEIKKGIKDLDDARNESVEKSEKDLSSLKESAENCGDAISKLTTDDLEKFVDQVSIAADSTEELTDKYLKQNEQLGYNSKEYQANAEKIDNNLEKLGYFKTYLENVKTKLENENEELDVNSEKYKKNQELLDKVNGELDKLDGYNATATATVELRGNSKGFFDNLVESLKNTFNLKTANWLLGINQIGKSLTGYALGGIVTQPTRALIGEAGYPEAVVPMTQDYLSTLASEIGKYSGGGKGGVVNVYLDGRLIQRQVQNTQDNKDFATNN